jgi:dipeptidyl aminopeptidase/acylaminoacyl peptidase
MISKFSALGLLLVVSAASAAPARHPITHEDLWLLPRVGAPVPSPDGKWAVVLVTNPAYDLKEQRANLWLLATDGSLPPRQLTQSKTPEEGSVWSPDSTRIAFSAKREGDEAAQLYVLNVAASGEAERVTNLTLGARRPKWSPDGSRLLFISDAYPGCRDEAANRRAAKERLDRKWNARVYESFPVRYWNQWLSDEHAHLFVQDAHSGAAAKDLFAGTKLLASPGFGPRNSEEGEMIDAAWAPGGAGIVFAAGVNRDEATRARVISQIFYVPASGGEPRQLTGDSRSYNQLKFSADGGALFCLSDEAPNDQVYSLARIARFPWPFAAGNRTVVTQSLDRAVADFALPAGSDRVWFIAEDAGQEKLYSVAVAGGEVRPETPVAGGCLTNLAAGGSVMLADWESATHPAEVVALEAGGSSLKPLTRFTEEKLAALELAPLETFWFTSARGKRIHSFLLRPPGFDPAKKYPLFVVIHGGAANMWRDAWVLRWNYHLLAAPGYAILLTDYTGSSGYGEKFGQEIRLDPLKGPADEVNEAADEALKRYPFLDASRQAAGGASYGGHLANWLEATTTRYKCIISHAGEADLTMQWGTSDSDYEREVNSGSPIWGASPVWRDQSPDLQGGNHEKGTGFVTPLLITVGEQDYRVPMNNALMFFALAQRLQVPSKLIVFPDAYHWIMKGEDSRFWFRNVQDWLAKWLQP